MGPHKWCRRKSMLCHLLESFDIVHVLAEAFLSSPYTCPDSPISTIYPTDFHHIPLPTLTQLHLSIFATLVGLLNLPVHSLKQACQNTPVRFCSLMVKNCHMPDRDSQDRNFWQILLFHHCPNSCFISFICSPSVKNRHSLGPPVLGLRETSRQIIGPSILFPWRCI